MYALWNGYHNQRNCHAFQDLASAEEYWSAPVWNSFHVRLPHGLLMTGLRLWIFGKNSTEVRCLLASSWQARCQQGLSLGTFMLVPWLRRHLQTCPRERYCVAHSTLYSLERSHEVQPTAGGKSLFLKNVGIYSFWDLEFNVVFLFSCFWGREAIFL